MGTVQHAVADTLRYLMEAVEQGTGLADARVGLRSLQMRHADVDMQLVWEEEPYDHSIHYDVLLRLPDRGTISLSYCDDHAKPWPLRGVHRWSDSDLVRVNTTVLPVDQAIACLDFIWDQARITDRLVNVCLVQEEIEKHPVLLSDDELQRAMDDFRTARRLHSAEDTHRWLERRGITHQELERTVGNHATVAHVRDRLVADRVQGHFDAHASDFDTVAVARLMLPDEASAVETARRVRSRELDFFDAAQRSVVDGMRSRRVPGPLFAVLQRREIPVERRADLFESAPGSLVGPFRDDDGYALVRVLAVAPARLDDPTRHAIRQLLFDEWLEERRQAATIEWLWGNARQTSQGARSDVPATPSHQGARP